MSKHQVLFILSHSEQSCSAIRQFLGELPVEADWHVMQGLDDANTQALIADIKPTCILMSYQLITCEAPAWIASFDRMYPERLTPILVITDSDDQAQAIRSLPYQPLIFYPNTIRQVLHFQQTVRQLITTSQLMADSAHQMRQMTFQMNTDFLTELHSRTAFEVELKRVLNHYSQLGDDRGFAVLLIDLDDFKDVNGMLGHVAGDQLIVQASERISELMRDTDFLARPGGDEFAVIMTDLSSANDAGHKAEELAALFESPFSINGHEVRITVSVGVVCYPEAGESVAELLSHVDIAMYRAKKEGGNDWRYYTEATNKAFYADLRLESAMRLALQNDELFLLYQPQYRLSDNKLMSAEVLMRWDRPNVGMVSPVDFIPLAEQSGMIHGIGMWLIESVFRAITTTAIKTSHRKLVINLSAKQLEAAGFADEVKKLMEQYQVTTKQFSFELTESALMLGALIETNLFQLADMGITFAIDDFGTGYSSLSYLRKLPVDTIKIDRSFISDVDTNINDARLVKSILAMAANLQLSVVAEGIETEAQTKFLQKNHCDIVQGYYFSRPLVLDDFLPLIAES